MPEHEPEHFRSCAVCERTILRGERVFDYLTTDREHRGVCALCRDRAQASGWIRADSPAARSDAPAPSRRRGQRAARLRERVFGAGGRLRGSQAPAEEQAPGEPPRSRAPEAAPRPQRRQPERPAAQEPEPETPERRMRRAVETFNASRQARVVAGLMKSLGDPQAAVRDRSRKPPRAEITVAWELSWYRWDVLLDTDEVREVAKGGDISELEDAPPNWNASVDSEGRLSWRESSS